MTKNDSLEKLLAILRSRFPNQQDFNKCILNIFLNRLDYLTLTNKD